MTQEFNEDIQLRILALDKTLGWIDDENSTSTLLITASRIYDFLKNNMVYQYDPENGKVMVAFTNGENIFLPQED